MTAKRFATLLVDLQDGRLYAQDELGRAFLIASGPTFLPESTTQPLDVVSQDGRVYRGQRPILYPFAAGSDLGASLPTYTLSTDKLEVTFDAPPGVELRAVVDLS